MNALRTLAFASIAAWTLSACVSQPVRAPTPADPMEASRAQAQRGALEDWSLSGRVAISNGRQGGSGRMDWKQQGGRYEISLAAPVTRQSWRLAGDARHARLEGIAGGPREGNDAEALLRDATGWDIPVRALVDWVRGVPAPEADFGAATMVVGAENLPASLEQAGWRIDYRDWYAAGAGQPALPKRLEAQRGEARVRLVLDDWLLVPGAAPTALDFTDETTPDAQLEATLQTLRLDDPAADLRVRIEAGDLRPVGVCGFACLAPGYGPGGAAVVHGAELRIIDGSGDVIVGDHHLALKQQAEAYARAYNAALAAWRQAHPGAATPAD